MFKRVVVFLPSFLIAMAGPWICVLGGYLS